MSSNKLYESAFLKGQKVDAANFLTELLVKKYAVKKNIGVPNYPFWRKEYHEQNTDVVTELSHKYSMEIIAVRRLLRVFDPTVLAQFILKTTWYSLFYLKKEHQKDVIFELYKLQAAYADKLANTSAPAETSEVPQEVSQEPIKSCSMKTKVGLIGKL